MKNGADYFRNDDEFIYLTAPYCEFYIPMEFFKSTAGFAEDLGETIRVIGLFDVGFFENGELKEMRTMKIPAWLEVWNYENKTETVTLPHSDEPTICRVFCFYQGQKVMTSSVVQDSANVLAYLKLICGGKLPHSIPYSVSPQIWRKNQEINGAYLGVPAVIEELILSVAYRNKLNKTQKFSSVAGKNDSTVGDYDYTMASIRQICQYTSTFTALWFEDFDSMVTSSLNRTRENKGEMESPLEKIIKM